ncbi:MAG: hypothetical protein R2748_03145 [Bryobacterales bacterium]
MGAARQPRLRPPRQPRDYAAQGEFQASLGFLAGVHGRGGADSGFPAHRSNRPARKWARTPPGTSATSSRPIPSPETCPSSSESTLKIGGTYRINRVSNFRPNDLAQGSFTFNRAWTRERNNNGNQGDGIADWLLGRPAAA